MTVTRPAALAALHSLSEPALCVLLTACQLGEISAALAIPVMVELDGLVQRKAPGSRWVVPTDLGLETVVAAL